jgi:hypothetical protein
MDNKSEVTNLDVKLENFKKEKYKLQRRIIDPIGAGVLGAIITSVLINTIFNTHDHYPLNVFIRNCIVDIPLNIPVGVVSGIIANEFNKYKLDRIQEIDEEIKVLKKEKH